jgi:DUF4097 and DUF4098 domain-containing protein YvlB
MRRESFPVDRPVELVVRSPAGSVEVEAADVSEATVELTPIRGDAEAAVEEAIVELHEGGERPELVVELEHGFRIGGRRGPRLTISAGRAPRVKVAVKVPTGSSVEVSTESADVTARGRYAAAEIGSASGDVRVEDVDGEAKVKSVSGDVTVGNVRGEASVNSVSGDASLTHVTGPGAVQTVSGDIEIGEALSSLRVKTISGDVRVGSTTEGTVEMQSVSGDLVLGLRSGSRLWIDARSTSGKTSSELAVGAEPVSKAGPLVEVRAKSVSGDIRVVRA